MPSPAAPFRRGLTREGWHIETVDGVAWDFPADRSEKAVKQAIMEHNAKLTPSPDPANAG